MRACVHVERTYAPSTSELCSSRGLFTRRTVGPSMVTITVSMGVTSPEVPADCSKLQPKHASGCTSSRSYHCSISVQSLNHWYCFVCTSNELASLVASHELDPP
jgi:hypothetical protein